MKTIQFTFFLVIGLILTNCTRNNKTERPLTFTKPPPALINFTHNSKTESLLNHTILKEEVYDAPIKTQVALKILISDTAITKQKVRELLTSLYDKTIKRTGFKYHSNPTNIFIYVYTSKEKAESGDLWIGMIWKSYYDTQPKIRISDTQLNSLTLKPVKKFGLSESIRREIYYKSFEIEDRADKEANIIYPLDKADITIKDIKKNGAISDKLLEKYNKKLAVEYKIDIAIIDSIFREGIKKGWPYPQ